LIFDRGIRIKIQNKQQKIFTTGTPAFAKATARQAEITEIYLVIFICRETPHKALAGKCRQMKRSYPALAGANYIHCFI
jgi:hypothetical protein